MSKTITFTDEQHAFLYRALGEYLAYLNKPNLFEIDYTGAKERAYELMSLIMMTPLKESK